MAEQNPLEEKIKEFEERVKHMREEEVKKEKIVKAEKPPKKKPEPILRKQVKSATPSIKPPYMDDIVGNAINKEERIFDTSPAHRYGRKLKVGILTLIAASFIGFFFVANTPYFNKWHQEKKRISSYNSRLHDIQNDIAKKRYDGIEAKVRTLANDLENEKKQQSLFAYKIADKNLRKLESLSYTKLAKVEARTERAVDKPGHYEQLWIEPEYEKRTRINKDVLNGVVAKIPLVSDVLAPIFKGGLVTEKIKVKEGHYENKWIEPTYKDVTTPAHYQKIEVNPLSGKEKIVEDNIPIK